MERNSIGSFIAALRRANGLTQQELADKLNVSNKAVSRWERDETLPDLTLIPAIAEIFGVTCDEILRGERKTAPETAAVSGADLEDAETDVRAEVRAAQKSERRAAAIVDRALSQFKTLTIIAAALIVIGVLVMLLIGMFIFNGAGTIGLVVMLIFDVAALVMTIIAVMRLRGTCGGEIADACDEKTVTRYERTMVRYSYAVFAVLFLVLWFFIFIFFFSVMQTPYAYETTYMPVEEDAAYDSGEVISETGYVVAVSAYHYSIIGVLLFLTLCSAAVLYLLYEPYATLLTGKRLAHVNGERDRGLTIFRIVCAALGVLSAAMLVTSSAAWAYQWGGESGILSFVFNLISVGCFFGIIVAAVIFVIKCRGGRVRALVEGVRCVLYTLSLLLICPSCTVTTMADDIRYCTWSSGGLITGVTIFLVTAAVSKFIMKRIPKKRSYSR